MDRCSLSWTTRKSVTKMLDNLWAANVHIRATFIFSFQVPCCILNNFFSEDLRRLLFLSLLILLLSLAKIQLHVVLTSFRHKAPYRTEVVLTKENDKILNKLT